MPSSTEVTLARGVKPKFPQKCIACHSEPNSTIKMGLGRIAIPICRSCKLRFRIQLWGRKLLLLGLVVITIFAYDFIIEPWHKSTNAEQKLLLFLCISPWILLEVFWPRIFKINFDGGYEFIDAGYAAEFFELNNNQAIDSDSQKQTTPKLWNPNVAANWSLLFTPLFGAWIQAKNWKELDQPKRAHKSMIWVYIGVTFLIIVPFLPSNVDGRVAGLIFLLVWYFSSAKGQAKYLKENNIGYDKKAWGMPLFLGFTGLIFYLIVLATSILFAMYEAGRGNNIFDGI
jgi:hypothetical protein